MQTRNRVTGQFETAADNAQTILTSHPLATVASAFGLGLVVGVVAVTCFQPSTPSVVDRVSHGLLDTLLRAAPASWTR